MPEPVVATGIGVVSPVGTGVQAFWTALLAGTSGIGPVESFDTSKFRVHLGAEIPEFAPEEWVSHCEPGAIGRASQLAVAAAKLALDDAGLEPPDLDRDRTGVAMGTTSGEPREVEKLDDRVLAGDFSDPTGAFLRLYPPHVIPATVGQAFGLRGPNVLLPTACAAGNYAIARGLDLLRAGRVDRMLVGGSDAFSRITFSGFARLGAVAPERCSPFDRERQGMVPGEGAAILVVERESDARRRSATIYAEVAGYGLSCDAHHMTAAHPEGDGPARAMQSALADSGLEPSEVDYISAHGTGTPTNDKLETIAVKRAFGSSPPPISSVKSMLGHTMGAASAFEAAVCCLAIRDGRVPPTINYRHPDPECDLDYIPNEARDIPVEVAMNNAYAFGGSNASVVFRSLR